MQPDRGSHHIRVRARVRARCRSRAGAPGRAARSSVRRGHVVDESGRRCRRAARGVRVGAVAPREPSRRCRRRAVCRSSPRGDLPTLPDNRLVPVRAVGLRVGSGDSPRDRADDRSVGAHAGVGGRDIFGGGCRGVSRGQPARRQHQQNRPVLCRSVARLRAKRAASDRRVAPGDSVGRVAMGPGDRRDHDHQR